MSLPSDRQKHQSKNLCMIKLIQFSISIIVCFLIGSTGLSGQTITTSGDTITYVSSDLSVRITGLPSLEGCGFFNGTASYIGAVDNSPTRQSIIQNAADPNRLHHLVERAQTHEVRLEVLTNNGGWGNPFHRFFENAANTTHVQTVGTATPNIGGSNFQYNLTPTLSSGIDASSLRFSFLRCIAGCDDIFAPDIFEVQELAIPIYLIGAIEGQEIVDPIDSIMSPAMPTLVLHDPPGDQSFVEFTQGQKFCTNIETSELNANSTDIDFGFRLGISATVGLFVNTTIEVFHQTNFSWDQTWQQTSSTSYETCMEFKNTIATPNDANNTAITPGQDYFFGVSTLMLYGSYEAWYMEDCKLKFGKQLVMAPSNNPNSSQGFEFSELELIEEISRLRGIAEDATNTDYFRNYSRNQANLWQQVLDVNTENKENVANTTRINFDDDLETPTTSTEVTSVQNTYSLDVDYTFESAVGMEFVGLIAGSGLLGGFELGTKQSISEGVTEVADSTREIRYHLQDDDPDDDIAVDVFRDPAFGTVIFKLREGSETSWPYEGGYQIDQPRLGNGNCTDENINIVNAPISNPSEEAEVSIPIKICNDSRYARSYSLNLVNTSNNNEAVISMNDVNLALLPFPFEQIPPDGHCLTRTLKVKQRDTSTFDYDNIRLYLSNDKDTTVRDFINVSVSFGDGPLDLCVLDMDFDNITDASDNCPDISNTNQLDTDEDGIGNACDNCPTLKNINQMDSDNDGIGDACDNCPDMANSNQLDTDGEGTGDVCDACFQFAVNPESDEDGDGLICDNCPDLPNPGLHFDGIDDQITFRGTTSDVLEDVADDFTYEFWVKPESTIPINESEGNAGAGAFINTSKPIPFVIFPEQGGILYNDPINGIDNATLGVAVGTNGVMLVEHGNSHAPSILVHYTPINEWTHIAIVYSGETAKLYINGNYRTRGWQTDQTNIYDGTQRVIKPSFSLGGESNGAQNYPQHRFKGIIDDLRIWDGARSELAIQSDMNKELVLVQGGDLRIYYDFNEGIPYGNNTQVLPYPDQDGAINRSFTGFSKTGSISNYVIGAPINMYDSNDDGVSDFCDDLAANKDDDGDGIRNTEDICSNNPSVGLDFDGLDDRVEIANNSALTPTTSQAITFETWVFPKSAEQSIIASQYFNFDVDKSNFFIRREANGTLLVTGNGTNTIQSNSSIPLNTWSHISVVFEHSIGENKTKIYINGELDVAGDLNYNSTNGAEPLYLGHITAGDGGPTFIGHLNGILDEVRIWDGARDASDIENNMNNELIGNETGLLAYYNSNEGLPGADNRTITNLADQTGNGNDGAIVNFTKGGLSSRGLSFDGINDHIVIPDSSGLYFAGDFTFEAWIRAIDFNSFRGIFGKTDLSSFQPAPVDFYLFQGSGKPRLLLGNGVTSEVTDATIAPPIGEWAHIAVVKEGTTITHYLNGVANGTGNITADIVDNQTPLYIGSRSNLDILMKGGMDDLRFWNDARTVSEISDNMNLELTGSEAGLVGYFPFDRSGNILEVVQDKSLSAKNVTPINFEYPNISSNWTYGAPVNGQDSDLDGSGDACDLCTGNDASGDHDMDGICDDLDPDCIGDIVDIPSTHYDYSTTIRASQSISTGDSTVVIGSGVNVNYEAGQSIRLGRGFEVLDQAEFEAIIENCNNQAEYLNSNTEEK